MDKAKNSITILAIGDRADYDSYRKLHKEKSFIQKSGFDYASTSYRRFLAKGAPLIKTKKVIIFLFFPFVYWNKYIEHRDYKGIYGNVSFYKKFVCFWNKMEKILKDFAYGKKVFFINDPSLCGLYRDKLVVARKFSRTHIPSPGFHNIPHARKLEDLLNKGHSFFLKPRYGSMGKGITYLNWSNWQTNFVFKNNKIISRRSDKGWRFRDVTGNKKFLQKLLKKDILIEDEINSILLGKMKVDMRVYVFFNKVIYVYPRRNKVERITTNIMQGAKGDPTILQKLPKHLVKKAKKLAKNVSKALKLNFVGMDIMIDHNLKDIYVIDVNVFPGFPKRKTFNLAQCMIAELKRLRNRGELPFEKGAEP